MCNTWEDATDMSGLMNETISCKKAAIVVVFMIYLIYIGTTGVIYFFETRENKDLAIKKLKLFK